MNRGNGARGEVIRFLEEADADFAVLLEVDESWLEDLRAKLGEYPYRCSAAREDNFGLALFSRFPIESGGIELIGNAARPSVIVRLSVDGTSLGVVGAHLPPPKSPRYAMQRNQQIAALAKVVAREEPPVMILGDLNMTPWSPVFSRLLSEANLVDARRGFGVRPTWPSTFPPLWIPIDHCLVSEGIRIRDLCVGPSRGSDHHVLVVDFSLRATRTAE